MLAVVVFIVVPFIAWYGTWFGRPLSNQQIAEYLHDEKARKVQHALWKIAERIQNGDTTVSQFYPAVAGLVASPVAEVRVNAAWVMGQDNHAEQFHAALLSLLPDRDPLVRRNAALALVRFHDASGHAEIAAMLRPYTLNAVASGKLSYRLKVDDSVGRGTMMAHLDNIELRSPVPGFFEEMIAKEGAYIQAGAPVLSISPADEQAWEAMRALYLIGTATDLGEINRYARGSDPHMSPRVAQQAQLAAAAIRQR